MNMKENNKYRYTDTSERNIRMNRFYIIASSLLAIVFLFYLWLKLVNHNIAPIVTYANTILIAVFCVVNAVTHLRNSLLLHPATSLRELQRWHHFLL